MFRTRYIKSLIIVAAAAAVACTADPADPADPAGTDPVEDAEPASLTLNFSVDNIGIGVSTRAGAESSTVTRANSATDPGLPAQIIKELDPDYPWEMSSEAAFIDGRKMTCLTVLLIHRPSNRIVGVRRIPDPNCPNHTEQPDPANPVQLDPDNAILNYDGSVGSVLEDENGNLMLDDQGRIAAVVGEKARITFDYNDPVHIVDDKVIEAYANSQTSDAEEKKAIIAANQQYRGRSAERLVRGRYSILAIANYDHEVTTSSTSNAAGQTKRTLNVDRTLENIVDKFHMPQYMAEGVYPFAPVPDEPELESYEYLYNIRFLMNHTLQKVGEEGSNAIYDVVHLTEGGKPFYPYIRPAVHQTLTASAEFYLGAGNNEIDLKLQRISSRTRVEVRNYIPGDMAGYTTDQLKLKINSLEFSKNYTQSTTYLFRRNKVDRDYKELATTSGRYSETYYTDHDGKGAPLVTYKGFINPSGIATTPGAIVPFEAEDNFVEANSKKCIFDALMYESSLKYKDELDDPDSFTYTIDVSYPGITNYKTYDINKVDTEDTNYRTEFDPDKSSFEYTPKSDTKDYIKGSTTLTAFYDSIKALEEGLDADKGEFLCFLVEGVGSHRFLYEKNDGTLFCYKAYEPVNLDSNLSLQGLTLNSFLWTLDGLTADGKCYLKNVRSGKHMSTIWPGTTPTVTNHMMSTDDTNSKKYQLGISDLKGTSHTGTFYATFSNTHGTTPYYLSVWAAGEYLSGWSAADEGCQYKLYPVKMTQATVHVGVPRFKKEVTLTAFSDETAIVEKVQEIRRNDFVRILVEVSYTPEDGEFKFRVEPWNKGSGSVDFN